jgi:hypothetical protein
MTTIMPFTTRFHASGRVESKGLGCAAASEYNRIERPRREAPLKESPMNPTDPLTMGLPASLTDALVFGAVLAGIFVVFRLLLPHVNRSVGG